MTSAVVVGKMSQEIRDAGNAVLAKADLNSSEAINLLYSRLIKEQNADFLIGEKDLLDIDSLSFERESRYHDMPKGQIKLERFTFKEA